MSDKIPNNFRDTPNANVIFSMLKWKHCKKPMVSVTRTRPTDYVWQKSNESKRPTRQKSLLQQFGVPCSQLLPPIYCHQLTLSIREVWTTMCGWMASGWYGNNYMCILYSSDSVIISADSAPFYLVWTQKSPSPTLFYPYRLLEVAIWRSSPKHEMCLTWSWLERPWIDGKFASLLNTSDSAIILTDSAPFHLGRTQKSPTPTSVILSLSKGFCHLTKFAWAYIQQSEGIIIWENIL